MSDIVETELKNVETAVGTEAKTVTTDIKALFANRANDVALAVIILAAIFVGHII